MDLLLEDRVEQAFRYLQPSDANHITKIIQALKQESFENLRTQFDIHKLSSPGEQVFVLRATPRLRILFKYTEDQALVIEDIVSHEMLKNFFNQNL
jgi:mRNA-degrading endonuclease YafQ of YafQ-DinJ toxin-antitoxin module